MLKVLGKSTEYRKRGAQCEERRYYEGSVSKEEKRKGRRLAP